MSPKHNGVACRGYDLTLLDLEKIRDLRKIDLQYLMEFYQKATDRNSFFLPTLFIDKLAGTDRLRLDIIAGKSEPEIRKSWEPGLEAYRLIRKKYLIYEDFD